MKKENHQETTQQETAQKETKDNLQFATKWASDVSEIVQETFKKQVDLSFERMNMVTKANLNFWAGVINSFNRPFRMNGAKHSFSHFDPDHDTSEQDEKPEKESVKEFHRR